MTSSCAPVFHEETAKIRIMNINSCLVIDFCMNCPMISLFYFVSVCGLLVSVILTTVLNLEGNITLNINYIEF